MTETVVKVPQNAMRLDGCECQFAAGDDQSSRDVIPLVMHARTLQPAYHEYWGWIVHDMDGMRQHKSELPIDYLHRQDEAIGFCNSVERTADGLTLRGGLVPFKEGDRVDEITHKRAAGVPYEGSIDFSGSSLMQFVDFEEIASVNGGPFEGPGWIVREWNLRGAAVCLRGVDMNTESQFADVGETSVTVLSQSKEAFDMTKARANKPKKQLTADSETGAATATAVADADETENTDAEETETTEAEETETADDVTVEAGGDSTEQQFTLADLKQFTGRFGNELGAKYLADGLTYQQALEQFTAHQASELKKSRAEVKAANQKLAAADLGEETEVSSGNESPEKEAVKKFTTTLGSEGLATFAALTKLPGQPSAN